MEFEPKDWILVRDDSDEAWHLAQFSHKSDDGEIYVAGSCAWFEQAIPYEGNESLLGTSDSPDGEKVTELDGWKVGDECEVLNANDKKWHSGKIVEINPERMGVFEDVLYPFFVESGCFCCPKWCKADQLRRPGEKEDEKLHFGDKVEVMLDGEWREAVIIEVDHSSIPYKVATPDGDFHWRTKSAVRHA